MRERETLFRDVRHEEKGVQSELGPQRPTQHSDLFVSQF